MAIATNQSPLRGTEGKMGGFVTRTVNEKTIISKASKRRSKKSDLEKQNHGQFKQAAAWAKSAMLDPELKVHFAKIAKKKKWPNGYTAAVSFKIKEIKALDKELKRVSAIANEVTNRSNELGNINQFAIICQQTEIVLRDALDTLSSALYDVKRQMQNENQKQVLMGILDEQFMRTLRVRLS